MAMHMVLTVDYVTLPIHATAALASFPEPLLAARVGAQNRPIFVVISYVSAFVTVLLTVGVAVVLKNYRVYCILYGDVHTCIC